MRSTGVVTSSGVVTSAGARWHEGLDSYQTGQVVGALAVLVLALALLTFGIRGLTARRPSPSVVPYGMPDGSPYAASDAEPDQVPDPEPHGVPDPAAPPMANPYAAPGWQPQQPAPRPRARSIVAVVLGGLLLLGSVGSGLSHLTGSTTHRSATLPPSLLGRAANSTLTAQLTSSVGSLGKHATSSAYGTAQDLRLVFVDTDHVGDTSSTLSGFRSGFEKSSGSTLSDSLGHGRAVDAGRLGGEAHCWTTTLATVPAGVCVYVDHGSQFVLLVFRPASLDALATEGLQSRELVLHDA